MFVFFSENTFFIKKCPCDPPYPKKILVAFDFRNRNNFLSPKILVHLEPGWGMGCTVTYPGRWTIMFGTSDMSGMSGTCMSVYFHIYIQ